MGFFKKKHRGSIHILLIQLFLLLFIVAITTLTYNNYSILLMDSYADDALTDALLAAGTVNVEEYGRQNQVILSDTLRAIRSDNTTGIGSASETVQAAYNSQSDILKQFLTDAAGNISWVYPEYRLTDDLKIKTNYGVDYQTDPVSTVQSSNANYDKIQYQVFNDSADGGYYETKWVQSQELDNAFLQFIQNLQNDQAQLNQSVQMAENKQLANTYDNFLTTFGWDFGLDEVEGHDTQGMTYNNFKYSGGRLGELTVINDVTGSYKSPIYIDYITVFNVYKHYIYIEGAGYVYYPQKVSDDLYTIRIGDKNYKLNSSDQRVAKLYEVCESNGLAGTPIYDKMIITKQTVQRNSSSGATTTVYNNLSENHAGISGVVIQSVDFLDPQALVIREAQGDVIFDTSMQAYIDQLINQLVTVYSTSGTEQIQSLGVAKNIQGSVYPSTRNDSENSRLDAKYYPNTNLMTYQITQSPNKGENGQLTKNKQNILIFNQAVMAQVEFDVQMLNPDGATDNNVRTAYYSRIIDITIQPPVSYTIDIPAVDQ